MLDARDHLAQLALELARAGFQRDQALARVAELEAQLGELGDIKAELAKLAPTETGGAE